MIQMETEMAAAHAKIQVFEANASRRGSRVSDGMHSYFEKANILPPSNLNPTAAAYIPTKGQTDSLPAPLVVRPKVRTQEEVSKIPAKPDVQTNSTTNVINLTNQVVSQTQETHVRASIQSYTQPSVGHITLKLWC